MSGRSGSDQRVVAALKSMIDEKNLVAVLKAKQRNLNAMDVPKFTVEGGNLSKQVLSDLFRAGGVEEMVENLKPFYDLTEGLNEYRTRGLVALENLLTKKVTQKTITSLKVAPPSISSIVAYILLKELEVENLTKIIRGKENAVPEARNQSISRVCIISMDLKQHGSNRQDSSHWRRSAHPGIPADRCFGMVRAGGRAGG